MVVLFPLLSWVSSVNRWSGIGVWSLSLAASVYRECINNLVAQIHVIIFKNYHLDVRSTAIHRLIFCCMCGLKTKKRSNADYVVQHRGLEHRVSASQRKSTSRSRWIRLENKEYRPMENHDLTHILSFVCRIKSTEQK